MKIISLEMKLIDVKNGENNTIDMASLVWFDLAIICYIKILHVNTLIHIFISISFFFFFFPIWLISIFNILKKTINFCQFLNLFISNSCLHILQNKAKCRERTSGIKKIQNRRSSAGARCMHLHTHTHMAHQSTY